MRSDNNEFELLQHTDDYPWAVHAFDAEVEASHAGVPHLDFVIFEPRSFAEPVVATDLATGETYLLLP